MTRMRKVATVVTLGTVGAFSGFAAASAGGGCHSGVTQGHGAQVALIDACFTPTTLFAEPGETITFVNRDPFAHNVSGTGWGRFEDMNQGDRFTTSFTDDGIYPFSCTLHPGMNGVVLVGDVGGTGAAGDMQPLSASKAPSGSTGAWIAAGSIGLLVGAATGAGLARMGRRAHVA